jgi:hypothetical protein
MTVQPNPLVSIWDTYQIVKGALQVATKATTHLNGHNLLESTPFAQSLKEGLAEINDLFVMSFWATFERFLRDYLQEKGTTLQKTQPAVLGQTMYAYFEEEVEFWKMEEVLEDILKEFLGPRKVLASQAKHILHYRNWIAHGKDSRRDYRFASPQPVRVPKKLG